MTVGFRFHPSDHEIISHYLTNKMNGDNFDDIIAEIDLCRHEPWELPEISIIKDDDREWYFFCRPDYKYRNSKRANRATRYGFWKPTGKVRSIKGQGAGGEIGTKRTLVFYSKTSGSASSRTGWVIHEYQVKNFLPRQREFVFCKLKDKAVEQADNLITEEGEPSNLVVFESEGHWDVAQLLQLPSGHNDVIDVNSLSATQLPAPTARGLSKEDLLQINLILDEPIRLTSQYQFEDSEEEVNPTFADSFLADPTQLPAPTAQGLSKEDLLQINLLLDEPIQLTSRYEDSEEEVNPTFADSFLADPTQLPAPTAQGLSKEDLLQINLILDESMRSTSRYGDSEEEVDPDSFIVDPDENIIGAGIHSNDYQSQRPMSKVYLEDVSDTDSEDIHGEYMQQMGSSKLHAGRGSSTEFKQTRRVQTLTETLPPLEGSSQIRNTGSVSKNIPQMSVSSMASQAEKTRQPVKVRGPQSPQTKAAVKRDTAQAHGLSTFELQANVHVGQASYGVAPRQRKQGFGLEPESGRRSVTNVITARQGLKMSESASASNKTDIVRAVAQAGRPSPPKDYMVAQNSSSRPSPLMVYIVNLMVGVLVFIIIVWAVVIL